MNCKTFTLNLFFFTTILFAQISGIVTNSISGKPIENVNITDGDLGTITNSMGAFFIDVSIGAELEFSHIAFQSIFQSAQEGMSVKLIPAVIESDQIIVRAGLSDEAVQNAVTSIHVLMIKFVNLELIIFKF